MSTDPDPHTGFADRLNYALQQKGWGTADLARATGFKRNRIDNWRSARNMPQSSEDYKILAHALNTTPDWLIGYSNDFSPQDRFLPKIQIPESAFDYWKESLCFVQHGHHEIWMQARLAPTLPRLFPSFKTVLEKDGTLRFILSDPDDDYLVKMLARHQFAFASTEETIRDSLLTTITQLRGLAKQFPGKIELRTISAQPSTVMYFIDPNAPYGRAFTVTCHHGPQPEMSPYTIADRMLHPQAFMAAYEQFLFFWNSGKPVNLNGYLH